MNISRYKISKAELVIVQGDITKAETQAIVNAANSSLKGGGGVDGAIHAAAGPQLLQACQDIVRKQGILPPGQAVITPGFNLAADYVIHTVGPVWRGGIDREEEILRSAYKSCLNLAQVYGLTDIAFPAISCGVYGFPVQKAAAIALEVIIESLRNHDLSQVYIYLFSQSDWETWNEQAADMTR